MDTENKTRTCRLCDTEKSLSCFLLRKDTQKYRTECKDCKRQLRKEYVENGPKTKVRQVDDENTTTRVCDMCNEEKTLDAFEMRSDTGKRRYSCLDCRHAFCRSYKNSDEYKARERERRKTDPLYRLEMIYRNRIHQILDYITSNTKPLRQRKSMDFLGCSIDEFKVHIEKQFKPGMSWEDKTSFVLDHIIPIAWFDMNEPVHQDICFHHTNFQPLTPDRKSVV